jgi:predicted metal-dependent hydrolase
VEYIKTAFLNRWNVLVLSAGTVFAFLTGHPDVALPLVLAGEVAYLGLLGAHPKFRAYVDAQRAKSTREETSAASERMLQRIMATLPRSSLDRYEALRNQCAEMRYIAKELHQPGGAADMPLEGLHVAGLDRLLWIYLRLLYTQFALSRFLEKTKEEDIQREIRRSEQRLAALPVEAKNERARATLQDNLQTSRARLENLQKARDNHQLVQLEIERLENKIRSLSEMAVNRQEPEAISGQVDAVASSMEATERTMSELRFATGLEETDETPSLVRPRVTA